MNGPHMATGRLETGNPNLQSETSENFDITFNFDNDDFYAYASFYVTDVDNYITLQDELDDHDDHDDTMTTMITMMIMEMTMMSMIMRKCSLI